MDVKRLSKQKVSLPMGALLSMYNEMTLWKKNHSVLTLFFSDKIKKFMDTHADEIEKNMIKLREINDRYFKSTNDGVFLKDPQGQLIPKETANMEEYDGEVQPLLQKQVEVEL